jgi:gamma-glutamyltranspeptidase/glutathione hydrolase
MNERSRRRSEWRHSKTSPRTEQGMVATRHPLAAEVGCSLLEQGGNAVDAAVGASFAGGVVQPVANTMGGGGLLVVHRPGGRAAATIDYRYESAQAASPSMFARADGEASPFSAELAVGAANEVGHLAVAVPGSVAGLLLAHQRWGSLPIEAVIAPAIELARRGFVMDWYGTLMAAGHLDLLRRFPKTARAFLREGELPYRPPILAEGDVMCQPALAATLERVRDGGVDAYYRGAIATEIVAEMDAGGGLIAADDLDAYRPREAEAVRLTYRGHAILGAANAALYRLLLPVLDGLDLEGRAPADPARLHLLIEAIRVCRAEQAAAFGDEGCMDASLLASLDSGQLATELASSIAVRKRVERAPAGVLATPRSEQTMHLSVIDRERMAVSLTETILGNWGSGVTTDGGILLNNGMSGFVLTEGHPNCVGPCRRPLSNMTPLLVLRPDGSVAASIGASGGPRIVAAVVQVLSHMLDCGLGVQEAIEQPRIDVDGDGVLVDARLGVEVASALEAFGHPVRMRSEELSTFEFGNPCGVAVSEDGWLRSGTSPFQTTTAVGY